MCRLFAWHSDHPVTVNDALGIDAGELRKLSETHKDGWGMAFAAAGHGIELVRDVAAAHNSDAYQEATTSLETTDAIIHLRWATEELEVCLPNTHPFIKEGIAFCHNGGLPRGAKLDSLMAPDLKDSLEGTTDSEQYFAALITSIRNHDGDFVAGYRALLSELEELSYTSLNTLILTDDVLYITCCHKPENLMSHVQPDYYDLTWTTRDGVTSAWSTYVRPSVTDGTDLPNGMLLAIDRKTGQTSLHRVRG
ncbi:MAG: class II glutamine amidotransferase [Actinomycetes bacterium]